MGPAISLGQHSKLLRSSWIQRYEKVVIPFLIKSSLSDRPNFRQNLQLAMSKIENNSRVIFVERHDERSCQVERCLIITDGKGCYYQEGGNIIGLECGCEGYGTVLHELLHALGFQHEQERPDRDSFVTIHLGNIKLEKEHNFHKLKVEEYRWNDFHFDFSSNMMYESYAFSANGQPTITTTDGRYIGRNDDLSMGDIQKLLSL